jgi:hypothetical protein
MRISLIGQRLVLAAAVFAGITASLSAQASLLWDWSYTGPGIAAGGTFTTNQTANADGYYEITDITGSRDGGTIIALEPAGDAIPGNPGFPVDNLIAADGLLTSNGFGFETADGNYANPYYADFMSPPSFFEVFTEPASMGFSELPIMFNAAIVPEPSTAALLITTLLGFAGYRSHHRRYVLRDS